MNPRATLALLVLTLLVVGGLWYLRQIAPATREAAEERRYAAVFDPAGVEEIDVVRGGETVSLRRAGDGWRLAAPLGDAAAPETVDRLLAALRFLQVRDRRSGPDEAALAEAGLAAPRLRVDLRGEQNLRLELGGETALPGGIFARVAGRPEILRVPDTVAELATAPVETFRDPRLTASVADDIEKFTVRRADGEMTLRRERGRWLIEKPVSAPADPVAVRAFLESLLGLRIADFRAAAPVAGALPGQVATISMTPLGGGEDLALEILRGADGTGEAWVVRYPPRGGLLAVDPAARSIFEVSPEALRDRSLGYVEADAVDRLVLESGDTVLHLRREGEGWADPDRGVTLTGEEVQALIDLYNETRASTFQPGLTASEAGLAPPSGRILFSAWLTENSAEEAAGGHPIAGADLGAATPDGVYARIAGSEEILTVPPALADEIRRLAAETGRRKP